MSIIFYIQYILYVGVCLTPALEELFEEDRFTSLRENFHLRSQRNLLKEQTVLHSNKNETMSCPLLYLCSHPGIVHFCDKLICHLQGNGLLLCTGSITCVSKKEVNNQKKFDLLHTQT